ncbi:MAG TPA: DUF6286 domain-containing protein [Micromonosporaceae bacterium]
MRVFDRIVAIILSIVLFGLGVLTTVEVIWTKGLGHSGHLVLPYESPNRYLHQHVWDSTPVRVISAIVAAVGLILLLLELKPRRPGLLTMSGSTAGVVTGISRRSLGHALSRVATSVAGVAEAKTRVRRRRAKVRARTRLRDPGDLEQRLRRELTDALDALHLTRPPRLRLTLSHREERE